MVFDDVIICGPLGGVFMWELGFVLQLEPISGSNSNLTLDPLISGDVEMQLLPLTYFFCISCSCLHWNLELAVWSSSVPLATINLK